MDTLTRKYNEIEKHLSPKTAIVRCPVCGSSNVRLGIRTVWGVPVFCLECERMTPVRRVT